MFETDVIKFVTKDCFPLLVGTVAYGLSEAHGNYKIILYFTLQLTFTSPPSQVCLEFSFALLFTANAFTLRFIYQEIWQCFSLQLTFTSPPPLACLEFTFALLLTASAFTLRLLSVKRYGIASHYN